MARNIPFRFEGRAPNWEAQSRSGPNSLLLVIIVHGLPSWSRLEESVEETVKRAPGCQGNEGPRIKTFRFNGTRLFFRGEGAFQSIYADFKKAMHRHVVRKSRFQRRITEYLTGKWEQNPQKQKSREMFNTKPSEKPPRMLFVANGVATSLVKFFLNECIAEDQRETIKNKRWNFIIQGFVLMEGMTPQQDLDYKELLCQEWSVLQKTPSMFTEEEPGGERVKKLDLAEPGITNLIARLEWIGHNFTENSEQLKGKIWLLPPYLASSDSSGRRSASNAQDARPDGPGQQKPTASLRPPGLARLRRNLTGRMRTPGRLPGDRELYRDNELILSWILELIGPTDLPQERAKDLELKLAEYRYFREDTNPDVSRPDEGLTNRPPGKISQFEALTGHLKDGSTPKAKQPGEAARSGILDTADQSRHHEELSASTSWILNDSQQDGFQGPHELGKALSNRSKCAKAYFENCSFHNASALYESCITMAQKYQYQDSDIVFGSRIQLAVIKTMRGHYDEATSDFKKLFAEYQSKHGSKNTSILAQISYHHAVVLVRIGDFEDAIKKLESIHDLSQTEDFANLRVNCDRLLGLAHAYLGLFTQSTAFINAANRGIGKNKGDPYAIPRADSNKRDEPSTSLLSGLEAAVSLSEVQILLMKGEAKEGLELVERLLRDTEKAFGTSHLLSLESRFIWCRFLTETGDLGQANSSCVESLELMAEYLGRDHPLSLKTTSVLVRLHKLNAYPAEAFTTSESLAYRSRELLGTGHRQTIRYEFQTAAINFWMGNHVDGLKQLDNALQTSKSRWGDMNPWTLSCAIEHGLALSRSGRSHESEQELEDVLRRQIRLFELDIGGRANDTFINKLLDYLVSISKQTVESSKVHPSLLHALETWAANELSKKTGARLKLAIRAQTAILEIRRSLYSPFKSGHFAVLQAGLDLANTLRLNPAVTKPHEDESHYIDVIKAGEGFQDHPLVLLAVQGQYLSKIKYGSVLKSDTERFLSIPKLLSRRLGGRHPDTLQALLTAIPATYSINKDRAAEMSDELRQRLHDPKVRPQRPVQCIQIEEQLGLFHYSQGNNTEAAEILAALAESLRNGERKVLRTFNEGKEIDDRLTKEISKIVGEALEQQRQLAERSKQQGHFADAVDKLRLYYRFFKAVHGEHKEVTEKVTLTFAVALWRASREKAGPTEASFMKQFARKQQEEAVSLLSGIICRMDDKNDVKSRLKEVLEGWKSELKATSPNLSSVVDSVDSVSMDDCRTFRDGQAHEISRL